MAQSVGEIALDIVVGQNNVANTVQSAMNDVTAAANSGATSVSQSMQNIGNKISGVGKTIMPVSAAVGGIGVAAAKTTSDFDSAMSQVSAISGATGADLEKLRDTAKEMGSTTKFSASESAEAMQYMAMAGWKTEDMIGGISGIMDLAAASGEDLATTSDIVTDALTAFGLQASDSGHFADVLAAASSNANTNVSMMGETFKYVAPVAGSLGYSAEDMSVAIGLMANSGIKASQAGTALRSTLTRMAKPTKESQTAMDALGLSMTNSDGTMKSFREIMEDMRTGFAGMTESEQASTAAMLGGQEAMSGILAIANSSDADFAKLCSAIDGSEGAAKNMSDTMQDNLGGSITKLKSALEGIAIQFGEDFTPIIKNCVDVITDLSSKFGELPQPVRQVIEVAGLVLVTAGPLLLIIGKIITAVGTIGSAVSTVISIGGTIVTFVTGTLMPALSGFFAFLLANPIVLVITAIIAVIALLVANWDTVKQAAISAWNGIVDCVSGAVDSLVGFFTETLPSAFSALGDKFSEIGGGIKDFFGDLWTSIKDTASSKWEGIKSTVGGAASAIKNNVTNTFNTTKQNAATIWGAVKENTGSVWNSLKETVSNKAREAKTGAVNAFNTLKSGVSTAMSNAKTDVQNRWTLIGNTTTTIVSKIKESGVSGFKNLVSGIGSALGNVTSTVQNGFNGAISFITSLPGKAIEWGKDFIKGLVDGIRSMIGKVKDAVSDVASTIKSYIHFSVPDVGPLTDYETYMPDFMTGLATGIKSSKGVVIAEMQSLTGDMAATASASINNASLSGGKMQNLLDSMNAKKNLSSSSSSRGGLGKTTSYSDYSSNSKSKSNEEESGGDWIFPIYIGSDAIDEYILTRQNRKTIRSGGRA